MAKKSDPAPAAAEVAIPDNWRTMTTQQKIAWRDKYRPAGAKKPAPLPPPAPPAAEQEYPHKQLVQEQTSAQPAPCKPCDDAQVKQISSDVAHSMSNQDARSLVARILRDVADALDSGIGLE